MKFNLRRTTTLLTVAAVSSFLIAPNQSASAISTCSTAVYVGLDSSDHINAGSAVSAQFFLNSQNTTPINCIINTPRYTWSYSSSSQVTSGVLTSPTVIAGETSTSITPASDSILVNKFIQFTLQYKIGATNKTTYSSPIQVWPADAAAPSMDTTAPVTYTASGNVLQAVGNGVRGYPVPVESYRWWSCIDNSDETYANIPSDISVNSYVNTTGITICEIVSGADSSSYTVNGSEFGNYFFPEVLETNLYGQVSGLGSFTPSITAVSVLGLHWEGNQVTASATINNNTYPQPVLSFQFQKSSDTGTTWSSVTGPSVSPSSETYTLTASDRSLATQMKLRVVVTAAIGSQSTSSSSEALSTYTYPKSTGGSVVNASSGNYLPGTYEVGQTVIGRPWGVMGTPWPVLNYQWYECTTSSFSSCTASTSDGNQGSSTHHGGANVRDLGDYNFSFVVPAGAAGKYLTWSATLTNSATQQGTIYNFQQGRTQNSGLIVGSLSISGTPEISGIPAAGKKLTTSMVTNSGTSAGQITYKWSSSSSAGGPFTPISGATQTMYTPASGDIGRYLVVVATATNVAGKTVTSTSTTPVLVSQAYVAPNGATLSLGATPSSILGATLNTSLNSPTSGFPSTYGYVYTWSRCVSAKVGCSTISGASNASYVTTTSDLGKFITANVKITNAAGTQTVSSSNSTAAIRR